VRVELTADEIAAATGGERFGPPVTVDGAGVDSREIRPGELFVAIRAARDGHDFVDAALAAGAAAYLTSRDARGGTAIRVADTGAALLALGTHARGLLAATVIGITGSVGKTSVKDLTAAALRTLGPTTASERSFNNELGVPITLLDAPADAAAVVVEMGARGPGHITLLCGVARPVVGVVTAVAAVHTEFFGTLDDVAAAKGELVESLPSDGTAVLNADDPRVEAMHARTGARVLRFGSGSDADVYAGDVVVDDDLRPRFRLHTPWGTADVRLKIHGRHQVGNAAAAAAAALAAGAPFAAVCAGLEDAELSPWRMALGRAPDGARILNDAYNANPTSMLAALQALAALPARQRVAVLGVMAELGGRSEAEHYAIAAEAAALGIRVVAFDTPLYGGTPVHSVDEAVQAVGALGPDSAVLVKGSRVAGLERVAARLSGDDGV
jgi:UDP-N-acetylmuramoyl-tripeptide--D-alanyl-D-alanine ligase